MSEPAQLPREQIDVYLARLRRALEGLPAADIEEIVRELRGHIAERAAESKSAQPNGAPIADILKELGAPENIAAAYRDDLLVVRARTTFSLALILRTTLRWATRTALGFMVFIVALVGYGVGLSLIACALLKPLVPNNIGLWISQHGMDLGFQTPRPPGPELLGWWIIPLGLIGSAAFILGSTIFLRWMLRFVPRTSQRMEFLS
jgi:hypothetical protein